MRSTVSKLVHHVLKTQVLCGDKVQNKFKVTLLGNLSCFVVPVARYHLNKRCKHKIIAKTNEQLLCSTGMRRMTYDGNSRKGDSIVYIDYKNV